MPDETKPAKEPPKVLLTPADAAKAKVGDHVVFFDGEALARRQALITAIDGDVASLKVFLPIVRGKGGGIAKVSGVKYSEKPARGCWGT